MPLSASGAGASEHPSFDDGRCCCGTRVGDAGGDAVLTWATVLVSPDDRACNNGYTVAFAGASDNCNGSALAFFGGDGDESKSIAVVDSKVCREPACLNKHHTGSVPGSFLTTMVRGSSLMVCEADIF